MRRLTAALVLVLVLSGCTPAWYANHRAECRANPATVGCRI